MTMRTEDREQLRRAGATLLRLGPRSFVVACSACLWPPPYRRFETEAGAVTRLAEHMMVKHRLQLTLRQKPKE